MNLNSFNINSIIIFDQFQATTTNYAQIPEVRTENQKKH
jgi:hypothetical protein